MCAAHDAVNKGHDLAAALAAQEHACLYLAGYRSYINAPAIKITQSVIVMNATHFDFFLSKYD